MIAAKLQIAVVIVGFVALCYFLVSLVTEDAYQACVHKGRYSKETCRHYVTQ